MWDWMRCDKKTGRLDIYIVICLYFHLYLRLHLYLFLYLRQIELWQAEVGCTFTIQKMYFSHWKTPSKEIDMPFVLESVLFKNEWYFCERHVCDSSNLKDIPKFSSLFQFITSAINILKTNDQILIFRFLDKHWIFQVSSLLQSKAALADLKGTQSAFCYSYLLVKCSSSMEVKNTLVSKPTLV